MLILNPFVGARRVGRRTHLCPSGQAEQMVVGDSSSDRWIMLRAARGQQQRSGHETVVECGGVFRWWNEAGRTD